MPLGSVNVPIAGARNFVLRAVYIIRRSSKRLWDCCTMIEKRILCVSAVLFFGGIGI